MQRPPGRPLRVLWLIKGLGPGGAERLLVLQARHRTREDFTFVAAYFSEGKDHLVAALQEEGVDVRRLPGEPWRWAAAIRRLVTHGDFDIVHAHSPAVAAVARLALRTLPARARPKLVVTEHNNWRAFHPVTRWANALTYPLDDQTLAVSSDVLDSVSPRLRRRVRLLVHGIDLEELDGAADERKAVRERLGLGDDAVVVITVANLRAEKAYPDLLEAARLALADCEPLVFLAVGQGPLEEDIRRLADEMGLDDRFRLMGHRSDVAHLLAASDLFVLSSHYEGFPIAVMEALAAGLPVVSTRVGGLPEAVEDGVEGVLVPPARPDLLAKAVVAVACDDEKRAAMSERARLRGQHFDARTAVCRLERVYREVVGASDS